MNHPFLRFSLSSILMSAGLLLAMAPGQGAMKSSSPEEANGGYFLLHRLGEDESDVSMLFIVKTAPPDITAYADRVTKLGKETTEDLDGFQEHDSDIQFEKNPLPQIEQDVRDSIRDDKKHQLLFGTKDKDFVRVFLISQIEASSYALNLAKVLADQETSPARAKTLERLSDQWLHQRDEAFRLLRDY